MSGKLGRKEPSLCQGSEVARSLACVREVRLQGA